MRRRKKIKLKKIIREIRASHIKKNLSKYLKSILLSLGLHFGSQIEQKMLAQNIDLNKIDYPKQKEWIGMSNYFFEKEGDDKHVYVKTIGRGDSAVEARKNAANNLYEILNKISRKNIITINAKVEDYYVFQTEEGYVSFVLYKISSQDMMNLRR